MLEFFALSYGLRILITLLLGFCVLAQTLAMLLGFYHRRLDAPRAFENVLEILILCEILVLSLLHGEIVNGYKSGLLVPPGYENIRILLFFAIGLLAIGLYLFNKEPLTLSVILPALIFLPILERGMERTFTWAFVATLLFFLGRSIKIGMAHIMEIRTSISALSVIQAVDTLRTGILFCEKDGYTLLSNHQMQKLMVAITGKIFRNALKFYEVLVSDQYDSSYKKVELEGQTVHLLPDGTAWIFTKTDISFQMKNYIHISASEVSELWALTQELEFQDQEVRNKSDELKRTIANLHILSKEKEIEEAKMRAHDILGQRLTVLLYTIQANHNLDHDLLASLSQGLLEELKAEPMEKAPADELKTIQDIFQGIGVDIRFQGKLPENVEHASLFVGIIREGSTNAVRHGFATQIHIKAEPRENNYHLEMTNNGRTTPTPITPGSGIGVMRKKVNSRGGSLHIAHHPIFVLSVILPGGDLYE